ncbi:MAG: bifunctional 4-hydroxy-2-oxoglutarate aldolase/2-dehydro-3-deoxy-phosphogluconate aldolase [Acidobacteria bacterium]|nr:bifunctional 4-hydroxy-2-oxoglutarate aldolase/2-dehydro-3-deoxy-phosphogluconate aldolase [Acidobacteriota bacterium]
MIPVIRAASSEEAICAAEGALQGGIPIAEITLTVPHALRVMETLQSRYGDQLLIGAGTVLDAETCRAALLAGAQFIVSPALDPRTIEMARRYGKICMPGAFTPTEVLQAWQCGADLVKVFPVDSAGGAKYIRALKGPFPQIEFVVTGGVSEENVGDFLRAGTTAVGVGEKIFNREALRQGNVAAISAQASRFLGAVRSARAA